MMYKFLHDAKGRIVYRHPVEPTVQETKNKKTGKRIGWTVHMEIKVTHADNRLVVNQWKKATTDYPMQFFDAHYSREQVISYFFMHHAPTGEEITEEQYLVLSSAYEAEARRGVK